MLNTSKLIVMSTVLGALLCVAYSPAVNAEQRPIDITKSVLTVRVSKAGAFSAFGHNHQIGAAIASGSVDTAGQTVELRVNAASLKVQDEGVSDKDRAEIEKTMLGPEVLDTNRYHEIAFRSTKAERAANGGWQITGDLTLHGETRPVVVAVKEQGGHYIGRASFRQTEFGMKPVKVAGGTIKVKDEVRIEFDIQLSR
jgi:polyisoprenoid-binding protein YceI